MQQEDLFDQWLDENRMYSFEGRTGVKNLTRIINEVCNYNSNYGSAIEAFLEDNPAAIETLVEYIRTANVLEWRQNLEELFYGVEKDDSED